MHYVYEHIRPDTRKVFYVGKGAGKRRTDTNRNIYWKRIVAKAGGFLSRVVHEFNTHEEALNYEVKRIKFWRDRGAVLCNLTDGGEGVCGYKHSEERKQKISKKLKGKSQSKEHVKKRTAARKGSKLSNETKLKISLALVGKSLTKETKEKISNSLKGENSFWFGKHFSEETRKKISQAVKGKTAKGYILATNKKTKETLKFVGTTELEKAGFDPSSVYKCCRKESKYLSHKGFTFERVLT